MTVTFFSYLAAIHHEFSKIWKYNRTWQNILSKFRNLLFESKSTKLHDNVMKLSGFCYIVSLR